MGTSRALIAACIGLLSLLQARESHADEKAKGFAVASVTRSGLDMGYSMDLELRGRSASHMSSVRISAGFSLNPFAAKLDWPCPTFAGKPIAQPCGQLVVLELEPGEYEFHSWRGDAVNPNMAPRGKTVRAALDSLHKRFRVVAGEAIYIGNINVAAYEQCMRGNSIGYEVVVSDMAERDLPLLQRKDARFQPGNVRTRLATGLWPTELEVLEKRAAEGSVEVQIQLGRLYVEGVAVPRDYKEAARWFGIAAEKRSAQAQYHLGVMHRDGEGFPRDSKDAELWFQRAAEQGHLNAQVSLAALYFAGRGVPKDEEKALGWILKAAGQGFPPAQYNAGSMYLAGQGTPQNYVEAIRWFREAAAQKHAPSQNTLGHLYRYGRGVAQDPKEAVRWFELAAEQSYGLACYNLGSLYFEGEGVPKDLGKAAGLYQRGAEAGDATSQLNIGIMYLEGAGVPRSDSDAYRWLLSASTSEDKEVRERAGPPLEALKSKIPPKQQFEIIFRAGKPVPPGWCNGKVFPVAEFRR